MSKLNLFQCLAASRPNYEDMFCLGRHIVRDLATCSRGAAMPAPIVTVSDVVDEPPPRSAEPIIIRTVPPAPEAPTPTPTPPVRTPAEPATPARSEPPPRPPASITERLNTQPDRRSPE